MEPFRIVNTHFEKDTLYSIGTVSSRDKHYSGNEFHSYKEIFAQTEDEWDLLIIV